MPIISSLSQVLSVPGRDRQATDGGRTLFVQQTDKSLPSTDVANLAGDDWTSRNRARGRFGGSNNLPTPYQWVLTTDMWLAEEKYLALHAGPRSIGWRLPLRAQDEATRAGHARFAQVRNYDGGSLAYDNATISIQFQAGNILPIYASPKDLATVSPSAGLQDFWYFLEMVNQPPILTDGSHNYIWLFYTSLLFPQMTIKGYVSPDGVEFEDTTDDGATVTWSCSVTAHTVSPKPWESTQMLDAYRSAFSTFKLF